MRMREREKKVLKKSPSVSTYVSAGHGREYGMDMGNINHHDHHRELLYARRNRDKRRNIEKMGKGSVLNPGRVLLREIHVQRKKDSKKIASACMRGHK